MANGYRSSTIRSVTPLQQLTGSGDVTITGHRLGLASGARVISVLPPAAPYLVRDLPAQRRYVPTIKITSLRSSNRARH